MPNQVIWSGQFWKIIILQNTPKNTATYSNGATIELNSFLYAWAIKNIPNPLKIPEPIMTKPSYNSGIFQWSKKKIL